MQNIIDNFNRANGGLGANYGTDLFGTGYNGFAISGNEVVNGGTNFDSVWYTTQFGIDQQVIIKVVSPPATGASRVYVRLNDMGSLDVTGYEYEWDAGNSYITRMDGALGRTTLKATGFFVGAGYYIRLRAQGADITVWAWEGFAWRYIDGVRDATYLEPGNIGVIGQNCTGFVWDDLGGGTLVYNELYSDDIKDSAPSSYYQFISGDVYNDQGTKALDLTDLDATIQEAPSLIQTEQNLVNGAVDFTLASGLGNGNSDYSFFGGANWTINCWVNPFEDAFHSGFQRIFESRDATAGWVFYGQPGGLQFDVDHGATQEGLGIPYKPPKFQPTMLTLRWQNSITTFEFFVNGIEFDGKSTWTTAPFPDHTDQFRIGISESLGNHFMGWMDDVTVWESLALADSHIQNLYLQSQPLTEREAIIIPRRRGVRR